VSISLVIWASCTVLRRCLSRAKSMFLLAEDADKERKCWKCPSFVSLTSISLKRFCSNGVRLLLFLSANVEKSEILPYKSPPDRSISLQCNRDVWYMVIGISSKLLQLTDRKGNLNQSNSLFVGSTPLRKSRCSVSEALANKQRTWESESCSVGTPLISLIWSPIFMLELVKHAAVSLFMSSIAGQLGENDWHDSIVNPISWFGTIEI